MEERFSQNIPILFPLLTLHAVTVARARVVPTCASSSVCLWLCALRAASAVGAQASLRKDSMLVQVTSHELCVSSFSCESTHAAYGVGPWSRRAEAGTGLRGDGTGLEAVARGEKARAGSAPSEAPGVELAGMRRARHVPECVCVRACSSEIFEGPQLKDSTLPFPFTISM